MFYPDIFIYEHIFQTYKGYKIDIIYNSPLPTQKTKSTTFYGGGRGR